MAYNRRSGGGYGGYGGGGGRYNSGGYRGSGNSGSMNPWQSNSGNGGPMGRQSQQGGHQPPPSQLAMASNIISKLLTSTNALVGGGYGGGNRNNHWNSPRMSHMGMRRQDGAFNKDNRRRSGDPHKFSGRKSGGGAKDADKRKSVGKVNDENKKGQNDRERTKEQLDADKKASYVGVPSAVLYCHICSKHMWDCESFEKHVRGRPHELMMTYLDESYKMRVDFMRHQIKAVENQREIDLERVTNNKHKSNANTTGNKGSGSNAVSKPLLRSYCPMCDVRFYGPLTGHRKSDRHRKLKQFLHPECKLCDALFHTRLEMDEHKLTAGHLKKVAEIRSVENPHLKNDEFDLIDMIKIEEDERLDSDQMPVAKKYEMLGDRDATKLKLELEGINEKKGTISEGNEATEVKVKDSEKKDELEASDTVAGEEDLALQGSTDQSTKSANVTSRDSLSKDPPTVAYDPDVAIGKELLVSSKGYVCRLCNCFLHDEQGVGIHCQTAAHYINYTTMTKMKEATSGGKKRGIDQVNDDVKKVESEKVVSHDAEITKEEPVVKRIKLDSEEKIEIDSVEQPQQETETKTVPAINPPKVEDEPVDEIPTEIVQPPVATPRGRGGNRGRGGRGGGTARRGRR